MATSHAVTISNLSKIYRMNKGKNVQAVNEIDLVIPTGCVFSLLGPNGAGKTTTIKMICGLVRPTTGSVLVNNVNVWQKRSPAMLEIGAVLEGTRNIHWTLSAWENLLYFGHLKGMWGKKMNSRAEQLLKEMELWDRRNDLVRIFSRGMQQKVAVACALIADPPIVLLDEPTLGLDVHSARTVKQLIVRLAKDFHKTILLTTHQLDMAQAVSDHVAIMIKGKIIANQPVARLLSIFRQEYYQIKVGGQLPAELRQTFSQMQIEERDGDTIISGAISGRQHLYQLIENLRTFDLPLISFNQTEPNLEEIFIHYVDAHHQKPEVEK